MNIKDLPQGSYNIIDNPKNINQLPSGSYNTNIQEQGPVIEEPKEPGLFSKIDTGVQNFANETFPNLALGVGKGIASTATGLGQLALKGLSAIVPKGGVKTALQEGISTGEYAKKNIFNPTTTAQKVGFTGEQIGEFLIPVGGEAKAVAMAEKVIPKVMTGVTKLDKLITGVAKLGAKSVASGAEFAAKTAAQTGGNAEEIKRSGVIGLLTPPVVKGITSAANKVAPIATSILAEMIGKEPEHIIRAFKNPVAVAEKIATKTIPLQVREKAINALGGFRNSFTEDFGKGLEELQKVTPQRLVPETTKTVVKDINSYLPTVFRNAKISVPESGILNFDTLNSSVVKGGEKKNLQMVYDTIKNQKDFSPKGMQAVAARINALTDFTDGNRNMSSVVVARIHDLYSQSIEKVYPQLAKLRNDYSASTKIWEGIDDVLKSVKNDIANPTAATAATKKLSNVFAEDNDAYLEALKRLEKVSGTDLLNDLAATEFKNLIPRRFGSVMMQAGALAGGLFYNPFIFATLPLFSPRLMGGAVTTAGKIAPYTTKALEMIPKVITPIINKR